MRRKQHGDENFLKIYSINSTVVLIKRYLLILKNIALSFKNVLYLYF